MITEIQKSYSTFSKSTTDEQGLPQRTKQLDSSPKSTGEFGEIEKFYKAFINNISSQRNDCLLEFDTIGWNKILDGERITDDETLIESNLMIKKAKDIINKYKSKTNVLLDNARKDISDLNVSENNKRIMTDGFDAGMKECRPQIDNMWDIEAKIVSEVENIFKLLASKKGSWEIQNNQILFKYDSDLNTYNSYISEIQELATKETTIQNQASEAVNNKMNNILSELKN